MSLGFEQTIFLWQADWAQGTRRRSGLRREGLEDKMPAEKLYAKAISQQILKYFS